MGKSKNLLCLSIAFVLFFLGNAQEKKVIEFDNLLSVHHSYSKKGNVKRLVIRDGKEKLEFLQRNLLKGEKLICDVIYECTDKLVFLPQIEYITALNDDIVALHGSYSFFGSVQHILFYSRHTKAILKWIAYYSSFNSVNPLILFYGDTESVLLNASKSIYQNRIYLIDYEGNTFETIGLIKKSMRLMGMGNYSDQKKKNERDDMFFEVKIRN